METEENLYELIENYKKTKNNDSKDFVFKNLEGRNGFMVFSKETYKDKDLKNLEKFHMND